MNSTVSVVIDRLYARNVFLTAIKQLSVTLVLGFFIQSVQAAPTDHFVTTWKTDNPGTSDANSIRIPMVGGPYDVDWNNDGIFDELSLHNIITHDFGSSGVYTVRIRGTYEGIHFNSAGDTEKILAIDQWGTQEWSYMKAAFMGSKNLLIPATDTPNFSLVTDMANMFAYATHANPDTSNWDTSEVTDMSNMFAFATSANPDTSNWNTSSVTLMNGMFLNAKSADPDTGGWDTSAVTNMWSMFNGAESANPDTSGWDTSAVTNMSRMFSGTESANPDTSGWDTSAVTDMAWMFLGSLLANPDTSNWDTSAVTDMSYMFGHTSATPDTSGWITSAVTDMTFMFGVTSSANPDTSNWDTSAVTNMARMFVDSLLANPDTTGWDTSAVTDMSGMFNRAVSANPDTSGWDTSAVTDMSAMFSSTDSANPDVSKWDTSGVINMSFMFNAAKAFDQDISSWNVAALQDASNMFSQSSSLSIPHYESLLISWSTQPLQIGVLFDAGYSYYCSASATAARESMIWNNNWTISDGGFACPPEDPTVAPDLTPVSDTGVSDSDNVTDDKTPDFFVNCMSAREVTLYTDKPVANTEFGTTTCGSGEIQTAKANVALPEGTHHISYTLGNHIGESGHSPSLTVTIQNLIFEDNFE